MDFLRIFFTPSDAPTYSIRWKPLTDLSYQPDRIINVDKYPGSLNQIDVPIDNIYIDWSYEIIGACTPESYTPVITGIVRANCRSVALTALIQPTPLPVLPYSIVINAVALSAILGSSFHIVTTGIFNIDWGDGIINYELNGGSYNPTHTYATPYTGDIKISALLLSDITLLSFSRDLGTVLPAGVPLTMIGSEVQKLTALQSFDMPSVLYFDGTTGNLPSTLTRLYLENTNLSGDVSELSRSLTYLWVKGSTTITGDSSDLPPALNLLLFYGANTLHGDVNNIPKSLTYLFLRGLNTLSGDITNMPAFTIQFSVEGNNTLSGPIHNMPVTITDFIVRGANTLSGSVGGVSPALVFLSITGNNLITGDIASLPGGMSYLQVTGSNTLYGDIANIPIGITRFEIISSVGNVATYTGGRVWSSTMCAFILNTFGSSLNASQVDTLLIDLANVSTWVIDPSCSIVHILGVSEPRTSASDAAVATLTAKPVSLILN